MVSATDAAAEATELGGAEMADDRRVGEQHERLGDQGDEGRSRDRQDPSIQVVETPHEISSSLWIHLGSAYVDMSSGD